MFVLCDMKDTVRIPPWEFKENTTVAIIDILNKKLANKVVYNVGLCIALWDLIKLEDSFIFPGDGATHTNDVGFDQSTQIVHYRYVVFRPFVDEILIGKIKGCSKEGVHVSMGFFDDIIIPADALQHPAIFDEQEQLWAWEYEVDEETKHKLFMDIGEELRFIFVLGNNIKIPGLDQSRCSNHCLLPPERNIYAKNSYIVRELKRNIQRHIPNSRRIHGFRVVDECFVDTTPTGPDTNTEAGDLPIITDPELKKPPYTITGSISESGLGCLSWWNG